MTPNQKVGLLTLIERIPESKPPQWRCQCDCGRRHTARETNLRQGLTRSCGCQVQAAKIRAMARVFSGGAK